MIRTTPQGRQYWYGVSSHARPENVEPLEELTGPATWYVRPEEISAYDEARASNTHERVAPHDSFVASRNMIMRDAFDQGLPAVFADDDLSSLKQVLLAHPHVLQDLTFDNMIDLMLRRNEEFYPHLYLNAPRADAQPLGFKYITRNHLKLFGSFMLVRPNDLFMDERFYHSEDYDYYLAHMKEYGGVIIHHDVIAKYAHGVEKGGFYQARTSPDIEEKVQGIYGLFEEKWGQYVDCGGAYSIGDNPYLIKILYPQVKRFLLNDKLAVHTHTEQVHEDVKIVLLDCVYRFQKLIGGNSSVTETLLALIESEELENASYNS